MFCSLPEIIVCFTFVKFCCSPLANFSSCIIVQGLVLVSVLKLMIDLGLKEPLGIGLGLERFSVESGPVMVVGDTVIRLEGNNGVCCHVQPAVCLREGHVDSEGQT